MWSRRIEDLIPEMQTVAIEFLKKCREAGHDVVVTCTSRTKAVQAALYAQGRQPLEEVNAIRKTVGLWSLTPEENKRPVTWTLESKHVVDHLGPGTKLHKSRALDFALRGKEKVLVWNPKIDIDRDGMPDYDECGLIAEALGLKWGGRFKSPDRPHVEWIEKEGI